MPLVWNDSFSTGIRRIDLQHQELIDMINLLETEASAGRIREALDHALPQLQAYILFHFGTEESMLGKVGAEHARLHKQQHAEFASRIAAFREPETSNKGLHELIEYLGRWLVEHIQQTDRELARLLPPSQGQ